MTESNTVHLMHADDTPHTNAYICKALGSTTKELTIEEFVAITAYPINPIMFSHFWQVILNGRSAHVGRPLLEYFGYEGDIWQSKRKFIDMLKRTKIPYQELTSKDDLTAYPTIQAEIATLPNEGAVASSKWLVMESNDIKDAIMQLKTKNGYLIRKYYIDMEELVRTYISYQSICKEREAQRKITSLEQTLAEIKLQNKAMMNKLVDISDQNDELLEKNADLDYKIDKVHLKLGIAAYDRAPLPKSASKQECFLLLKLNDPEEYWDYYTIRAQQPRANASLRMKQKMYPNLEVLINMPCHPNSKSLYVRIKDDLNNQGVEVNGNNLRIIDENVITEAELVTMMKRVYRSRLDIANEPIDA